MDQREWDAGARLPRDRHATETRSPQNGPESPEKPRWGSVADTGSLQPSPEALAWAQRAEAWAEQPPENDERAGPHTHPVDGVGWRTETAEWTAAEQTARWRQTTEWRSASGDQGWRSTTEAWQTGGSAEGYRPPADPPTRQQLAISGTAWPTDQPAGDPRVAQTPPRSGWQEFDGTPPWRATAEPRPAWQQFATPTPPWQAPNGTPGRSPLGTPSVDSAETASNPPWQQDVPVPPGSAPPQPVDTADTVSSPPWRQSAAMPAQRNGDGSSWQQLIEPTTYTSSAAAGRVDDDPVPWRVPEAPDRRSRHRSDEPRWDDTDDGDDGNDQSAAPAAPTPWRGGDSDPGWRERSDGWRPEPDSGSWSRGEEPRTVNWRRRRVEQAVDDTGAPGWRDAGPHTDSWRRDARPAADPWAHHTADTGYIPMSWDQPATHPGNWRADPDDRDDHVYRARRRVEDEPPVDPEVWRRDPGRHDDYRERPPVGEAVTEIRRRGDSEGWRQDPHAPGRWQGQAARGPAVYRGGHTEDWRRELAEQSDLAEGEARRFGTQDFVPFRPARPAPPPPVEGAPVQGPPVQGSPAQGPPAQRGNNGARWHEPPDTQWPPRGAVTGSYERRVADSLSATSGRLNLLEPDDDLDQNNGGPLAAVGYTIIWYGVPVVLFVLYMLVVTGDEKAHALSTLANAAPQFGLSLAVSMLVAVLLRWISGSWKAVSVGLAAAVLGGGLATVLTSAITGNPLS